MPYEKVEPVPVAKMLRKRYHGHNTICQKLREIFVSTEDEEIKYKCRVAMAMAKKMHERLKHYKRKQLEQNK
jgi:hypothetical protein